jgi:hypothetical protein
MLAGCMLARLPSVEMILLTTKIVTHKKNWLVILTYVSKAIAREPSMNHKNQDKKTKQ